MDDEAPISEADARTLRFLKGLVTVLTATMILGVLAIVALLVIRLQSPASGVPALALPEGVTVQSVSRGADWFAVVTEDGRVLVFDAEGGLRREFALE